MSTIFITSPVSYLSYHVYVVLCNNTKRTFWNPSLIIFAASYTMKICARQTRFISQKDATENAFWHFIQSVLFSQSVRRLKRKQRRNSTWDGRGKSAEIKNALRIPVRKCNLIKITRRERRKENISHIFLRRQPFLFYVCTFFIRLASF